MAFAFRFQNKAFFALAQMDTDDARSRRAIHYKKSHSFAGLFCFFGGAPPFFITAILGRLGSCRKQADQMLIYAHHIRDRTHTI